MQTGCFSNNSVKHSKVMKPNSLTLVSNHSSATYTFFETFVFFFLKIYLPYLDVIFYIFVVYLLYHIRLIRLSGDTELNPGPKRSSFKYFSICNTIYSRVDIRNYHFDITIISESYVNSDTSSSNDHFEYTCL